MDPMEAVQVAGRGIDFMADVLCYDRAQMEAVLEAAQKYLRVRYGEPLEPNVQERVGHRNSPMN